MAHPRRAVPAGQDRPSAVLLPVVGPDASPRLVFVRRATHLRSHAGQVGFPGGRVEPSDGSVEACALREAHEEIGLPPESVDVLGPLDEVLTVVTGYHIAPILGRVRGLQTWRPDPGEVEAVIEVDLEEALRATPSHEHEFTWEGKVYRLPSYLFGATVVWGATGRILDNLRRLVREAGLL